MNIKKIILLFLIAINLKIFSQELNCQVTINSQQLAGTEKAQIFDQLQKSIYEFMNNTKWTKDNFAIQEKIECSFLIIIKSQISDNAYSASIQVQSRRPVYKSSYFTETFNYEDDNFDFSFQQFSQLDFQLLLFKII